MIRRYLHPDCAVCKAKGRVPSACPAAPSFVPGAVGAAKQVDRRDLVPQRAAYGQRWRYLVTAMQPWKRPI
jgi:hypothetical protein